VQAASQVAVSDSEIEAALGGKTGDDAYDEAVSLLREKADLEAKLQAANKVGGSPLPHPLAGPADYLRGTCTVRSPTRTFSDTMPMHLWALPFDLTSACMLGTWKCNPVA
jgi:hypothetical protein